MKWGFLYKRLYLAGDTVGDWIARPFQTFVSIQAAGGIMMIVMTTAAMVMTNSSLNELYNKILHINVSFGFDSFIFSFNKLFIFFSRTTQRTKSSMSLR